MEEYIHIIIGVGMLVLVLASVLYKYYKRKSGNLAQESKELEYVYEKLVGTSFFRVMEKTDLFVVIFYPNRLVFCREHSYGWFVGNHPNQANFSSLKQMSNRKLLDQYKTVDNKNQLSDVPFEHILDTDKKNYFILYSDIIRITFCRDYTNQVAHNFEGKIWIDTKIKEREYTLFPPISIQKLKKLLPRYVSEEIILGPFD